MLHTSMFDKDILHKRQCSTWIFTISSWVKILEALFYQFISYLYECFALLLLIYVAVAINVTLFIP